MSKGKQPTKKELSEILSNAKICDYSFDELVIFADACRRAGISEFELREFCLNAANAYGYILDKVSDELIRRLLNGETN